MKKKSNRKRIMSAVLSAMVMVGTIGSTTTNLYADTLLPMPERPTLRNVFTYENIHNTFSAGNNPLFITELNTVKQGNSDLSEFKDVITHDGVGFLTDVVSVSTSESVSTGHSYHLALKSDGTAWQWKNTDIPKQVPNLTDIVSITTSTFSVSSSVYADYLALKSDGTIWRWSNTFIPKQVPNLTDIVSIASSGTDRLSSSHLALKSDGTIWQWSNTDIPKQVPNLEDVVSIATSTTNTYGNNLALKSDGTVWFWTSEGPAQELSLQDVVSIATSGLSKGVYSNNLALKSDGTVWNWTAPDRLKQIQGLGDIVSISGFNTPSSNNSSLALKSDGTVWAFNGNDVPPKRVNNIQIHMLYNFNNPQPGKTYQGGQTISIDWEMVSHPVESFDIYYIPLGEEKNQSAWVEIEKDVSVSSLNPQTYNSPIKDEGGNFLTGTKYSYEWELPNEFMRFIKVATIPNYK